MKIDVYSDVSCPWCYVGERRFKSALGSFDWAADVEVTFRPYLLDPGAPAEARPLRDHLRQKFGGEMEAMLARVTDVAAREGIALNWEDALSVQTLDAHRLTWLARNEYGLETQQQVVDLLFEAHFTNGQNVADPDVLSSIAEAAGMSRSRVAEFLSQDEGLYEVQQEIAHAQSIGIRAVPTFVFENQYALQGAQAPETFRSVLEEVRKLAAQAGSERASAELCEDGFCES